jgi:hypothetical protein
MWCTCMNLLPSLRSIILAATLGLATAAAQAHDESIYPDWSGQWTRSGGPQWDPTRGPRILQQPPLTDEYQDIFLSNLADLAEGGTAHNPTYNCGAPGMPRMMIVYEAMEIVITPPITYLMQEYMNPLRRIYTDGRPWPDQLEPTSAGYSIGQWLDQDGDGRLDTLVIETRGIKGERVFDGSGIPLHKDNQTVVKERIWLDQQNPNLLHDEITTIDHALTRPWTVTRSYARTHNPTWFEYNCVEDNRYVQIGPETYIISDDGHLLPTRKDQPAPDLTFFNRSRK